MPPYPRVVLAGRVGLVDDRARVALDRRPSDDVARGHRVDEVRAIRERLAGLVEVEERETLPPGSAARRVAVDEDELRPVGRERRDHHRRRAEAPRVGPGHVDRRPADRPWAARGSSSRCPCRSRRRFGTGCCSPPVPWSPVGKRFACGIDSGDRHTGRREIKHSLSTIEKSPPVMKGANICGRSRQVPLRRNIFWGRSAKWRTGR